ncbi:MADS-box transcription factor CDM44 [Tanacetum coccineum]
MNGGNKEIGGIEKPNVAKSSTAPAIRSYRRNRNHDMNPLAHLFLEREEARSIERELTEVLVCVNGEVVGFGDGGKNREINTYEEGRWELSSQQEYLRLKARYEALQRSQRNLLGEDLGPLNCKELESLEKHLDSSISDQLGYQTDPLSAGAAGPSMNNFMQMGWLPC